MPRFIELTNFDAFEQFAAEIQRARKPLSFAYCHSFQAFERSRDLLKESERVSGWYGGGANQDVAHALHNDAYTSDVQAEMFASTAILLADDLLRRFYRQLFGKPLPFEPGYGKAHNGDVRLTTLLQAGGNAIRHVSWWADNLKFPYPEDDAGLTNDGKKALANIRVIEKAFGSFGGPWNRPPTWDILFWMNAGSDSKPDDNYDNFEAAIVDAALEMAEEHSPGSATTLRAAINAIGPRQRPDPDDPAACDESHEGEASRSETASLSWTTLAAAAVVALLVGGWLGFCLGRGKAQDE